MQRRPKSVLPKRNTTRRKKHTRREIFLGKMEQVVPWARLIEVIEPCYPRIGKRGRRPIGLERRLRMFFVQQWYGLADEAVKTPSTTPRLCATSWTLT